MKFFALLLLFFSSALAHAQPITISFKDQPLPVFLKTLYADILKSSYLISPALAQSSTRVNMELVFKDREDLITRLPAVLSTLGVSQSLNGSAYMLGASTGALPSPLLPSIAALAPSPSVASLAASALPANPTPPPAPDPLLWHVFKPSKRSPDFLCSVLYPSTSKDKQFTSCTLAGGAALFNLTQKAFDALRPVLDAIDSPSQRVEISTALAEVTLNNSKGSGLRVVSKILGGSFEFGTPGVTGSGLTFKAGNFSLVLDALSTDTRVVHVVSPSGVVDSGQKLDLAIGDRQPTLAGIATATTGIAQQAIQYQQAGALLGVTPTVYGDGLIKLDIDSEVSSFSQTTTGITQSPTISQRKVSTSLTLQSGQVVALGGLRSSKDTGTSHKLFGWSAGSSTGQQSTDLVLLVYAKILPD